MTFTYFVNIYPPIALFTIWTTASCRIMFSSEEPNSARGSHCRSLSRFPYHKRTRNVATPPGWDASPSQVTPQHFVRFPWQFAGTPFILLGGERHCESKLSCPRTQHSTAQYIHTLFILYLKTKVYKDGSLGLMWTQYNTEQNSTAQHSPEPSTAQHRSAQHNTTQHNTTQHNEWPDPEIESEPFDPESKVTR